LPSAAPWSETQSVQATNGSFNVLLGSVTSLPVSIFGGGPLDSFGPLRFLQVTVSGEVLSPRRRIGSAAYAVGGALGPTGPTGPVGATGPAGSIGATGPIGPTGPQGSQGLTGSQGPQGVTGARGPGAPACADSVAPSPDTSSVFSYACPAGAFLLGAQCTIVSSGIPQPVNVSGNTATCSGGGFRSLRITCCFPAA
jgi:predicted outer membrane repeat protein